MKPHPWQTVSAILILLATACAPKPGVPPESMPLRVAYTDEASDYVILLADGLNYFGEHGITVQPIYYSDLTDGYADLAIGKIEAINAIPIELLPAVNNDNLRILMVSDYSNGADVIIASSAIQSIEDLRGKRIGVPFGSSGELFVQEMLRTKGMTNKDVTLVDLPKEATADAIPTLIDAGYAPLAVATNMGENGNHILFSSAELPGLLPKVMTFRKEVIQDHPDEVRAFIAAWFEAAEYWKSHPQAGNAIIAQTTNQNINAISYANLKLMNLQDNLTTFALSPGSDPTSIMYVMNLNLDLAIKSGIVTLPVNTNLLLDSTYLQP